MDDLALRPCFIGAIDGNLANKIVQWYHTWTFDGWAKWVIIPVLVLVFWIILGIFVWEIVIALRGPNNRDDDDE
jgi:uncharacterized membrane protein